MLGADVCRAFALLTANVTGETGVDLLFLFLTSEAHLIRVDHDDEVASINVWRENWLVFATQNIGNLHGKLSKDLIFGVHDPPFTVDLLCFGCKRLHSSNFLV